MSWMEQLQTANWHVSFGVAFGCYLLGCFTTGYYLVRLRTGQDIRELGSGSVGARNAGRILGKSGFALTALGDVAKGVLAILLTNYFTPGNRMAALAMLGVVVGHIWPVQLRFHGGKGIATILGALLLYDYHQALTFIIIFACAYLLLRKTVLPGLCGVFCLPIVDFCFRRDSVSATIISIAAGLVLLAHRKNIVEEIFHLLPHDDEPHPEHPDL